MTGDELFEATMNAEQMRIINTLPRTGNPGPRGYVGPEFYKDMSKDELIEKIVKLDNGDMDEIIEIFHWRNKFNDLVDKQVKVQIEALTSDKRAQAVLNEVRREILCTQGVRIL